MKEALQKILTDPLTDQKNAENRVKLFLARLVFRSVDKILNKAEVLRHITEDIPDNPGFFVPMAAPVKCKERQLTKK